MKIVCINVKFSSHGNTSIGITYGKTYDVLNQNDIVFIIRNDLSNVEHYVKYRFITLEEYREQRIDKILKL